MLFSDCAASPNIHNRPKSFRPLSLLHLNLRLVFPSNAINAHPTPMKTPDHSSVLLRLALLLGLTLPISQPASAAQPPLSLEQAQALVAGLHFQDGTIDLQDGLATLQVPPAFRFLDGADANTVLVKIWGNPPQDPPLGMLLPAETSPLSEECWAVIITYEGDGYV